MNFIGSLPASPREAELLISFADLTLFTRTARAMSDLELAAFCQQFYERVATAVEAAGGRVIKFIGDAALIVFAREKADAGTLALLELKRSVDAWFREYGYPGRMILKIHAGKAVLGVFGGGTSKQLDVLGSDVNQTAVLESTGVALSVAAFRALSPDVRRRFKKHTPPVTYIPVEEKH